MPTCLGFHKTVGVFQRTCGRVLLKVDTLWRTQSKWLVFSWTKKWCPSNQLSPNKSSMCFISARPQAGIASRLTLVSPEPTTQAIFEFHESGRNEAGKWAKLDARIKLSKPSLRFAKVSSYEARISTWLKRWNLNVMVRAKAKWVLDLIHLNFGMTTAPIDLFSLPPVGDRDVVGWPILCPKPWGAVNPSQQLNYFVRWEVHQVVPASKITICNTCSACFFLERPGWLLRLTKMCFLKFYYGYWYLKGIRLNYAFCNLHTCSN